MDIQWFTKGSQSQVTIYETNITLNTVASRYFSSTFATLIGFNRNDSTLLIKSLNKEDALNSKYHEDDLHKISIKPSYGRINGKNIIRNICKFFPLDFSSEKLHKFPCSWDEASKCLIIFLKEEIN